MTLVPAQVTVPIPAEMKALSYLVGEWQGTMSMQMPGAPKPQAVKSTVSVKVFGAYQETVYTMEMPGMGKFTGHSFTKWDPEAKAYKSWTFDDMADAPREETGTFDGKKLVMLSAPQGGMVTRISYENKGKDAVGFLIEMKSGDSFAKLGECLYKRIAHK